MGKVVMYCSVSVDGFIADGHDDPGPLFEWLVSGDVPLDESGVLKVSQTSYDYIRPYWDQIGATIVGRHVFDMTDGWEAVGLSLKRGDLVAWPVVLLKRSAG